MRLGFARGVELDVIASQLGHRDLRMTKRYARIAAAQVHQAVAGLDALLLPATEESKGLQGQCSSNSSGNGTVGNVTAA